MHLLSTRDATLRVAHDRAREILDCRKDPLLHAVAFEKLWIKAKYPVELSDLGQLPDHIYLAKAYGNKSDPEVRQNVHDLLLLYAREYEKEHEIA